jgi:hypothetical protein
MSAAAATAVLVKMWPGLRRSLLSIGRWLLDVIVDEGVKGLLVYMRQRVKVFGRRLRRVLKRRVSPKWRVGCWRAKWLRGRIARWRRAIAWLGGAQATKLKGRIVGLAIARATREIPTEAPDEVFARWRRRQR